MTQIIPAILATTEQEYLDQLRKVEHAKIFNWVHIDFMDNKFVPNQSIKPSVVANYPLEVKKEAHLMLEYPENWIEQLVTVKVERIIFPIEDREGVEERITHLKNHGIEVGLSVNPETAMSELEPYLGQVDLVLVMSVHPGFQAQEFIPESINKVKECVRLRSNRSLDFKIEMDGGISLENVRKVSEAGADLVAVGSQMFKYDNLEEALKKLKEAIND